MNSFIVDETTGDFARWLRILGFDTKMIKNRRGISLIAIALKEEKLIITRSSKLLNKEKECCIHINSTDTISAIVELKETDLLTGMKPFSRCIECNTLLQKTSKNNIIGRIPPYIFKRHNKFSLCPRCGRIYWKGSHLKRMVKELQDAKIIDDNSLSNSLS